MVSPPAGLEVIDLNNVMWVVYKTIFKTLNPKPWVCTMTIRSHLTLVVAMPLAYHAHCFR